MTRSSVFSTRQARIYDPSTCAGKRGGISPLCRIIPRCGIIRRALRATRLRRLARAWSCILACRRRLPRGGRWRLGTEDAFVRGGHLVFLVPSSPDVVRGGLVGVRAGQGVMVGARGGGGVVAVVCWGTTRAAVAHAPRTPQRQERSAPPCFTTQKHGRVTGVCRNHPVGKVPISLQPGHVVWLD